MINVTKPYLPSIEEYFSFVRGIWDRNWLTNQGPLVQKLEQDLKDHLNVPFLQYTGNGTIPLQIAIKVLNLSGEIITTPFSYVATTGAILWENCKPIFVDIDPDTFCIDANKIEKSITKNTSAILATHVYGIPCNVKEIERIAHKHHLKVIYDGAHAFGVTIEGKSIFSYGDISTCSFHATKLFHTIEGGAIICNDPIIHQKASLLKTFGHAGDDYVSIGINGKNSEFHAAMGLCNLPQVNNFIRERKEISSKYKQELNEIEISYPKIPANVEYNYSYFPVIFKTEKTLLNVMNCLTQNKINSRRYFFPSLNTLSYLETKSDCPISEDISTRVLCLPFYQQLSSTDIETICSLIKSAM